MLYVDDLLFEVFLCVLRCYHVPERFDQVLRYRPALRPLGTTAAAKAVERRGQGHQLHRMSDTSLAAPILQFFSSRK